MPIAITIPRLGWNMDEGIFVQWLKGEGDQVRPGDRIFSLESEKSVQEIESLDGGTLHIPAGGPQPGEIVAVGTLVGYLLQPGETPADLACQFSQSVSEAEPAAEAIANSGDERATPQAAAPAALAASDKRAPRGRRVRISPRARRKAAEVGLDYGCLAGSGRLGRIRERDVLAAAAMRLARCAAGAGDGGRPKPVGETRQPFSATRRTVARRMLQSHQSTAPVTLTAACDATNLVNLREQFKAADGAELAPSYTDFILKLAAAALLAHPAMASRLENEQVVVPAQIDIALAVDTPQGLAAPVVRNVGGLGLRELALRRRSLIEKARAHRLLPSDLQGGVFTVTNLGAYGIDAFTPLINPPQCATLGIGRIQSQPVVRQGALVAREVVTLSLTFDHQLVDGALAARFLQTLCQYLENPGPRLLP